MSQDIHLISLLLGGCTFLSPDHLLSIIFKVVGLPIPDELTDVGLGLIRSNVCVRRIIIPPAHSPPPGRRSIFGGSRRTVTILLPKRLGKAQSFPEVELGRWIRLAARDLDQDGDTDLALGSLAFEVVPPMGLLQEWVRNGVPFVVLENRGPTVQ